MNLGDKVDKILDTQIKVLQRITALETINEFNGKRSGIIYGGISSLIVAIAFHFLKGHI